GGGPARLGAAAPRRTAAWLPSLAAAVIAAMFGSSVTYWALHGQPAGGLAEQVLAGHLRSLQVEGRLVDVASSDRHTVKPWFGGRLDFSPAVRDLAAEGFPLVRGRLDYLAGPPLAAPVSRRPPPLLNPFLLPPP